MSSSNKAVGGYFELELPPAGGLLYPQAHCFQSARSAFLTLLQSGKPRRVWMPKYICQAMPAQLARAGIAHAFYAINADLDIAENLSLEPGDWLLYVNYFGICGANIERILARYDRRQVVIDNSQALYAAPLDNLATLYSPRKFFGVPDGGLLVTELPLNMPASIDTGSAGRAQHLLKRLAATPEAGYADYQKAEQSLIGKPPQRMSYFTRRLLESVDYRAARLARNENFRFLHKALGRRNRLPIDLARPDGPLCYPLLAERPGLRERLLAQRVFLPAYWPEISQHCEPGSVERRLLDGCLPIPCDQRYRPIDLERIVMSIDASIDASIDVSIKQPET